MLVHVQHNLLLWHSNLNDYKHSTMTLVLSEFNVVSSGFGKNAATVALTNITSTIATVTNFRMSNLIL